MQPGLVASPQNAVNVVTHAAQLSLSVWFFDFDAAEGSSFALRGSLPLRSRQVAYRSFQITPQLGFESAVNKPNMKRQLSGELFTDPFVAIPGARLTGKTLLAVFWFFFSSSFFFLSRDDGVAGRCRPYECG